MLRKVACFTSELDLFCTKGHLVIEVTQEGGRPSLKPSNRRFDLKVEPQPTGKCR